MLYRLISILIGYGCGMFLSGYMYGKSHNVDIRKSGSGNVGTTNTLRTLGAKAGFLALLGDTLKAVVAAAIVWGIYRYDQADIVRLLMLYAAFGAVLGHDFPIYMKFKGGKGIATSFGMLIVAFPQTLPVCILVFFVCVFLTRYVSLGSILTSIAFVIQAIIFGFLGWSYFTGAQSYEAMSIAVLAAVIAVVKHRSNIGRLLNHNENKISFKKTGEL